MNIISCDNCGVLLDKGKLDFPIDIYDIGGSVDAEKAGWDCYDWVPKVNCPVCKEDILETD